MAVKVEGTNGDAAAAAADGGDSAAAARSKEAEAEGNMSGEAKATSSSSPPSRVKRRRRRRYCPTPIEACTGEQRLEADEEMTFSSRYSIVHPLRSMTNALSGLMWDRPRIVPWSVVHIVNNCCILHLHFVLLLFAVVPPPYGKPYSLNTRGRLQTAPS